MQSRIKACLPHRTIFAALSAAVLIAASFAGAQTLSRIVGTVTATSGNTLTVKTDAGQVHQVEVPSAAILRRIEPGQTTLQNAETIKFSDLAIGDRVLVNLNPGAPAGALQASAIIAIKQTDLAKRQEQEREEWQRNGVGGLVKSVEPATGTIEVTSGAGPMAKTVTIHTTKTTILKRYAPASVRYNEAKPAPFDAIHPGDQLEARGTKNADGTELTADEVVSGSFRNVSGRISSIDAANSTFTLKDLATKKMVTVHIGQETQMRQLPDRMAMMLAAVLKGGGGQSRGAGRGGQFGAGGRGPANGAFSSEGRRAGGDLREMLSRAPMIHLSDLHKGDAVMLVSTEGTTDVTAITLLAGVEPILEAPASRDLLSSWSMDTSVGGSGGEGAP